jgi:hypothetical protein
MHVYLNNQILKRSTELYSGPSHRPEQTARLLLMVPSCHCRFLQIRSPQLLIPTLSPRADPLCDHPIASEPTFKRETVPNYNDTFFHSRQFIIRVLSRRAGICADRAAVLDKQSSICSYFARCKS